MKQPFEKHVTERIYIASSISLYGKSEYDRAQQELTAIFNDDRLTFARGLYASSGDWLARWPKILQRIDRLIFLTDSNWIGRGVWTEIDDTLRAGKMVHLYTGGKLYAVESLDQDGPVVFGELTDDWGKYCEVRVVDN
jgi:hypothetical protein